MFRYSCALFCALLALSILEPTIAKKSYGFGGGRHSYPKSGGLSGGGHHYPSSGGLSGGGHGYPSSGGSHGYPSSGGLSGGGHGYPSSGGSHNYPSSGGSHGYPSSGGLSGSGQGSSYPSNTHHTNNHGYPAGKGLSGNTPSTGGQSTTNVHYHYHYTPPQQIRYTPVHGGAPVSYPVYRGSPPTYVYQYKDSGSKYGTLLAGLALLNLGALAGGAAGAAYAHSQSHSNYKPQPGEVCKFSVKKENGDYEETKIDCQLITSFIFEEQAKAQSGSTQSGASNTSVVTTTVTNVTTVNTTNMASEQPVALAPMPVNPSPPFQMLPNGTLLPMNVSSTNETVNTTGGSSPNNTMTSSVTVTTTTTNTTVTNALDVKGKPIEVTPGMKCYVIRHSPTSNMRRSVPCGLLQTYADKSLRRNSAVRNAPAFTVIAVIFAAFVLY